MNEFLGFYILNEQFYIDEAFAYFITTKRNGYPCPKRKDKWFINKAISEIKKCWEKSYGTSFTFRFDISLFLGGAVPSGTGRCVRWWF